MKMRSLIRGLAAVVLGIAISGGWFTSAPAANHSDKSKIVKVLKTYERALNGNDVNTIVSLYTKDGVFMPQNSKPQIGLTAIRKAYVNVFKAIDLDIKFDILEVGVLSDKWAFARTTSAGTTKINATGAKASEGNQELFLLKKLKNGQWKFARYIFSTTKPRR